MKNQNSTDLAYLLHLALSAREFSLQPENKSAVRLFNGFYEGEPRLVVDLYGRTLVLWDHARAGEENPALLQAAMSWYLEKFPWLGCVLQKARYATNLEERRGRVLFGMAPDQEIEEGGIRYALNLRINQDASFYLDTSNLRAWFRDHAAGWSVLNTFAYTGALGIAALAGGAGRVVQTDKNRQFLALARVSAMLNRLDLGKMKLVAGDFFSQVANFKQKGEGFDCVILDPPFFSITEKGTVDLQKEYPRLVNKIRPLVRDGGWLVLINNALFLSGMDFYQSIEGLCQDGYLNIEQIIPVPAHITGYPGTLVTPPPADPSPFNHSTKILLLKVKRKAPAGHSS